MGALNFIATMIDLRAPGMSLMRMPLTCGPGLSPPSWLAGFWRSACRGNRIFWTVGGNQFLHSRRYRGERSFRKHSGGSPLLWQHLFWFFGHPEVYIAILRAWAWPLTFFRRLRASRCMATERWFMPSGHRLPGFHGLGPSHVCERHEPLFGCLFVPDSGDRSAFRHQDVQLAGNPVGRPDSIHCHAFCPRFVSLFVSGGLSGIFLAQPAVDNTARTLISWSRIST